MDGPLKSSKKIAREIREMQIYDDYNAALLIPGSMKEQIKDNLMKTYDIKSRVTVWHIIKRVANRINAEKKQETTTY